MKSLSDYLLVMLLTVSLFGCAAAKPSAPTTEQGQVAEAEALIRYSLTERIVADVEENYTNQVSSFLAGQQVPPDLAKTIVSEEIEQLSASEEQRLLDNLVPIYRRFYTAEEIHQLLSFYRTEVARKSLRVSSRIAAESRQYVRLWHDHYGDELLERIYERLEQEGVDVVDGDGTGH